MKKIGLILLLICTVFMTGCFSYYKTYEKTPCLELGSNQTELIKKIALETGYHEKNIVVTDSTIAYHKKRRFAYKDIRKVIVQTKVMLKGKRYSLIVVMKNKEKHVFRSYDLELAINVYSAFECFAGIAQKNASSDKYDRLKKLKELLDSGAINEDEYEKEKAKILEEK